MSVSLSKGQGVSLKKNEYDLSSVTIGLGWDINEEKKGFLGGIFGKKEEEYDLDVIAFLCNSAGKVTDLGNVENGKPTLVNGDIIFFNSLRHKSGNIWLTGDNRTGAGDGDVVFARILLPKIFKELADLVEDVRHVALIALIENFVFFVEQNELYGC